MKIVYLVQAPKNHTPEGKIELERRGEILAKYAAPGTVTGMTDAPSGPITIESRYEKYLCIPTSVVRALELQEEGWDAIILGCFGDPGLDAHREILSIPVIGPGEACFLMAASLGHRFSLLTITESVVPFAKQQIRIAGVGDKLASVIPTGLPVLEIRRDPQHAIEVVTEIGQRAIDKDGADTLILGCMTMAFLEIAEKVAPVLGVPVLNPARVSLKFAEAMIGSGLTHSKLAYRTPPKLATGEVSSLDDLSITV